MPVSRAVIAVPIPLAPLPRRVLTTASCLSIHPQDTSGPAINIQIKLMSYISVVLTPVFANQVDYWWVSLIIIGAVLIATPFYIWACPPGLSDKDRVEVFTKKDGGAAYAAVPSTEAAVATNGNGHHNGHNGKHDGSGLQMTEVDMAANKV